MTQWEHWLDFVIDRWIVILVAIIALVIVIKVVKTIVKWLIVIAIVAALLFYGANYTDAIKDVSGKILEYTQEEIFDLLSSEISNAEYVEDANGRFTITSGSIKLEGSNDSDEVTISYREQSFTIKKNPFLDRYITEVKGR